MSKIAMWASSERPANLFEVGHCFLRLDDADLGGRTAEVRLDILRIDLYRFRCTVSRINNRELGWRDR